ncbi:MAG: hypothetical protein K2K48_04840 [Anaeroplasmataceae bacterium]|nr:hypothetical protein [Anaeroplasmataceae bacterium]
MTGSEIATLIISLISIIFSASISFLLYFWSRKDTSTDYKIKDEVIKDLLLLEGNLNSICIKSGIKHLQDGLSLESEVEFIKKFLVSPTMSFILSYDNSEENSLFYLDLFLIVHNSEKIDSCSVLSKNTLEMLHNICNSNIMDKIKKTSSLDCLKLITTDNEKTNWLLRTTKKNVQKKKNQMNPPTE